MESIIQNELLENEEVLWSEQPNGNIFTTADMLLIPFSLMWGGFALFWEYSVLTTGAPLLFKLWGIPFVLIGLYMIVGRFFYKSYAKKNTCYYITNQRVIIIKNIFKVRTTVIYLNDLQEIEKNIKSNGTGNIIFGSSSAFSGLYTNTGMDFFLMGYGRKKVPSAFYDLDNAIDVYKLINIIKNK